MEGHPGDIGVAVTPTIRETIAEDAKPRVAARDRALDTLRGLFILMMISSHISDQTMSYAVLHLPRWFTGAEGFVLLSGVVLGIVHHTRLRAGELAATRRILRRAGQLYVIHCALTLSLFVARMATGQPTFVPDVTVLGGWPATIVSIATLSAQPRFMDVLPLYVLLLLGAPLVLGAMRRGASWLVLIASVLSWLYAQANPGFLVFSSPVFNSDAFHVPAWQLLFVIGLLVGHNRAVIVEAVRPYRWLVVGGAAAVLATTFVLAQLERPSIQLSPITVPPAMLSKTDLGPIRLLTFFSFIIVAYWVIQALEPHPFMSRLFGPLQTIGRRSLASFILLVALTVIFVAAGGLAVSPRLQDIFTLVVMLLIYGAARSPLVRRVIPN